MAATLKSLVAVVLVLGLVGQGFCQCDLSSITVKQSITGTKINGRPEYAVNVTNNCICTHQNVVFNCKGFNSVEKIDPAIFKRDGSSCLLNNGEPFHGFDSVVFNYAWDNKIALTPASSNIACS